MKYLQLQKTIQPIRNLILFLIVLVFLYGCKKSDSDGNVVPKEIESISPKAETYDVKVATEWNDLHLSLLLTNQNILPPYAARAFGIVNLALYESSVLGTSNKSMLGQFPNFNKLPTYSKTLEYNWGLSANIAQYTLMKELFAKASADDNAKIDALRLKFERQFKAGVSQVVIERSINYGAAVANAIWEYAKTDGTAALDLQPYPIGFVFADGLGAWRLTGATQNPLLPSWSSVRGFVPTSKNINTSLPFPFSYRQDSDFFKDANEVVTSVASLSEVDKQRVATIIGNGDSNRSVVIPLLVLNEAIKSKNYKLNDAALVYLKSGISIHDGTILNFKNKYQNNLLRPESYVRETVNKNWKSFVTTPNTPSFPSLIGTVTGVVSKIISNELKLTTLQNSFGIQNITDLKKAFIDSEVKSGTNFRFSGTSGITVGEKVVDSTNSLKFN